MPKRVKKRPKTGSAARFGSRYGARSRKQIASIEKEQKKKHQCPECKKYQLKRESVGVWICTKCGLKVAGGAWRP